MFEICYFGQLDSWLGEFVNPRKLWQFQIGWFEALTSHFCTRSADFIVSLVAIPREEKHSLLILGHSAEKSHRSRRMRLRPSCGRDFPSCDRIDNNYGSTWYVRQLLRAYCWFAWTVTRAWKDTIFLVVNREKWGKSIVEGRKWIETWYGRNFIRKKNSI